MNNEQREKDATINDCIDSGNALQLRQQIAVVEQEIVINIEQNAMLHKEKMQLKRELWELKDNE